MKKVFVTGGTGFIGSYILPLLHKEGYEIYVLVRSKEKAKILPSFYKPVLGDCTKNGEWQTYLSKADIVINLAGQNIFSRWNESYKRLIFESRVKSTKNVVSFLRENSILINASAIGYYGDKGDILLTEDSPPGDDFLAKTCIEWEKEAQKAKEKGAKVIITRIGIVLGKGGMFSKILPIFRLGLGGTLGKGNQWFSWIHIEDIAQAIMFLIKIQKEGIYNLVSPNPVTNKDFVKTLGSILKRPAVLPVPVLAMRILFGELANVITYSVKAYPKNLLELGFKFRFENIKDALKNLI
ncbi:MAG: TIGR01777 family oxidoreductase [Thermodesulfobacterium sp.]|nr:TIGR01777 family oxidoreductase [Thermodesulfobacterium sp.]